MSGALIGTLIGAAIEGLTEITRAALAARMREVAEQIERGDLVSDEEIAALKASTATIRKLLKRGK